MEDPPLPTARRVVFGTSAPNDGPNAGRVIVVIYDDPLTKPQCAQLMQRLAGHSVAVVPQKSVGPTAVCIWPVDQRRVASRQLIARITGSLDNSVILVALWHPDELLQLWCFFEKATDEVTKEALTRIGDFLSVSSATPSFSNWPSPAVGLIECRHLPPRIFHVYMQTIETTLTQANLNLVLHVETATEPQSEGSGIPPTDHQQWIEVLAQWLMSM